MRDEHPTAAAEALAAVPFLASLSAIDLAKLAGVLEDQWFDAGSEVFEAGGKGDALFIMREGLAERRVAGSRIGLINPPEVFGELALLTDQPRSSSVVAVTPIRVWVLPQHRVIALLRAEPELLFDLSRALGSELAKARRALGDLQRDIDRWISERLAVLAPPHRSLVEAISLFEEPPPASVLAKLAHGPIPDNLSTVIPLLRVIDSGGSIAPAMREAIVRDLDARKRRDEVAATVHRVGKELESGDDVAGAIAAYRAAGSFADVARLRGPHVPQQAHDRDVPPVAVPKRPKIAGRIRLIGLLCAFAPLLLWSLAPPAGLSVEGWRALLTLIAAAILFATDALPEAVVALALLAAWVVGGVTTPRSALDGFATQAWILVLSVLAVGVAVGNSGLLYRLALLALGNKPVGFIHRCLTLALVGVAVTPALPNATSRAALAAPMVREVAEALGYVPGSKAAGGLAMAAFIGFGQMPGLFLTGSSVGILLYGMMPSEIRAQFNFTGWFIAALPLHAFLFVASQIFISRAYKPDRPLPSGDGRLALQRAVLGPIRREEVVCAVVMVAMIAGFVTEPWHGVHGAWVGVGALLALAIGGALDTTMLKTGVNWPFLVFFGVITSLASVFQQLGVDAWLAGALAEPIGAVAGSSLAFCVGLTLIGFLLSFVIRWQAAAPLLVLIALPMSVSAHVNPFLTALISLVATQVWFLPYQSTVYLAFHHGTGNLFTHRQARPLAWIWGLLVVLAIVAAWPVWRMMGLVS